MQPSRLWAKGASALLLASFVLLLVSCGGGGGSSILEQKAQVTGNWQFALTTTDDSFSASPLQGGFLQQNNGTLSGQIAFFIIPTRGAGALPAITERLRSLERSVARP